MGFLDKERVEITSACGSVILEVCLSEDVRKDSVLIYSGTEGVNNLTTSKHSFEGRCAVYQDEKIIKISKG